MAIEIVGFRKKGKQKFTTVDSVRDVYTSPQTIIAQIPLEQQSQVSFSIFSENEQEFMPIRLTKIKDSDIEAALGVVCKALNTDIDKVLSHKTKDQLDVLVQLKTKIDHHEYSNGYFPSRKTHYEFLLQDIVSDLLDVDIGANADASVFDRGVYLPLPGIDGSLIINNTCEPLEIDLLKRSSIAAATSFFTLPDPVPETQPDPKEVKRPEALPPIIHGFRTMTLSKEGVLKPGPVAQSLLLADFDKQAPHIALKESKGVVYRFNGKSWELVHRIEIESYCEENVRPAPNATDCKEFCEKIYRTNVRPLSWFDETTYKKINFQNGVLDIATMRVGPHSETYGFRYILPYAYNPEAVCPTFDQHLRDITCEDEDLQKVLLEFAGYAISNDPMRHHLALILRGEGSNGKSTFIKIIKNLAGKANYSSATISQLSNPQYLATLEGKLFNISEEAGNNLYHSDIFKTITSGGEIMVKRLYAQPYSIQARAKIIIACNKIPESKDTTEGFFRRFLIIPFDKNFDETTSDVFMDEKLEAELPGIFNRVLAGYKRLHSQKKFTVSQRSIAAKNEYIASSDNVVSWYKGIDVEMIAGHFATTENIYQSYKNVCETENDKNVLNMKSFAAKLIQVDPRLKERRGQRKIAGKNARGFEGVKFHTGILDIPTY